MKKGITAVCTLLALMTALSAPVSAASIITGDSFSRSTKTSKWETDRYEPEEFDLSDNTLCLSVGSKGAYKSRPADKKDKFYALQGRKLACDPVSSNTWTATVKINLDDAWFSSNQGRKRAEFRVDLVDSNGNPVEGSPAFAFFKGGSGAPTIKYFNPAVKGSWASGRRFVNGDKETEDLIIEDGWHTLIIKSNKGILGYFLDEKKLGNCTLDTKDVYPSYMALNVYNYDRPDMVNFDNCYLYNGSFSIPQLSSSAQDKKEDRLSSQYERKRNSWEDRNIQYKFKHAKETSVTVSGVTFNTDSWYSQGTLKSKFGISNKNFSSENDSLRAKLSSLPTGVTYETREKDDMPESYWDY